MLIKKLLSATSIVFVLALLTSTTNADHSWGPPYHWARTTNPFELIVVNSTTSNWDPYVTNAVYDWSRSANLNMMQDLNGSISKRVRRQCKGRSGQIRICNLAYGKTGWLGVAGISIDVNDHITRGYTKLNDTYFSLNYYSNFSWKQSVTCQELGHNVGLNHQDQNFYNDPLFSCMDYQDPPFAQPNTHDYLQLDEVIYAHTDSYNSYSSGGGDLEDGGGCNAPPSKGCNKSGVGKSNGDIGWGISLGRRGQLETFIRIDPDGTRHITHVIWAIGY